MKTLYNNKGVVYHDLNSNTQIIEIKSLGKQNQYDVFNQTISDARILCLYDADNKIVIGVKLTNHKNLLNDIHNDIFRQNYAINCFQIKKETPKKTKVKSNLIGWDFSETKSETTTDIQKRSEEVAFEGKLPANDNTKQTNWAEKLPSKKTIVSNTYTTIGTSSLENSPYHEKATRAFKDM